MMDRMKESVFSALGEIDGLRVLDLYAGSGSLGLEALSRGATKAVFVENAREALLKLEQNLESTGLGKNAEVQWIDVRSLLANSPDDRYDLIFVDPPYNTPLGSVRSDCESIVMQGYLSDSGRVVVHRPAKESALEPLGLELSWEREFGQSRIYVFSHEEEEE